MHSQDTLSRSLQVCAREMAAAGRKLPLDVSSTIAGIAAEGEGSRWKVALPAAVGYLASSAERLW